MTRERMAFFVFCAVLILAPAARCLAQGEPILTEQEKQKGFVPLFNGKDFTGWKVLGKPWLIENGVMICPGKGYGWVRTEKHYKDFILRLEYKISKGGNSGIFIRAAEKGNPAFSGMEVQILDDYGRKPTVHTAGALYGAVAPCKNMSKPAGEWNQVEITCKGSRVKMVMNGVTLYDIDMDDPELNARIMTYKGHGAKPLNTRVREGYIGLQNHGARVEFRKIRIKILD